jgi:hypothetical protein
MSSQFVLPDAAHLLQVKNLLPGIRRVELT